MVGAVGDHDTLEREAIPVLERYLTRIQTEGSAERRAKLLRELSRVCENELGDPSRALTASLEAYREQPYRAAWHNLERLAAVADGWSELATALVETVRDLDVDDWADAWVHVGIVYEERLAHPEQALYCYRSALECDERCPEARRRVEALLRARGEWAELVRLLEERLQDASELERRGVALELAAVYAQLGQRKEAIFRYETLRSEGQGDLAVLTALERLYQAEGCVQQLIQVLEAQAEVVQGARNLAALYMRMAVEWEQQMGSSAKAEECLEWVLNFDPTSEEAYRGLERLYAADGRWLAAVDVYSRHAAIAPASRRAELHAEVARICERELGDAAGAIESYRKLEADRPGSVDAMSAPLRLFERTEDFDQMVGVLERRAARETGTAAAEIYQRAGELTREHLGDTERATALFNHALAACPTHVPSMVALAEIYREGGERPRAARILHEATLACTNRLERTRLLVLEADVRRSLDDPKRAMDLYGAALELDPAHLAAATGLVELLERSLDFAKMRAPLEMLIAHETDLEQQIGHLLRLARVEEQLGSSVRALSVLGRALALDPRHLGALRAHAALHVTAGRHAEAYAALIRVAERANDLSRADQLALHWRLAHCAFERGCRAESREHLAAALALDPEHRPSLRLQVELDRDRPAVLLMRYRALLDKAPPGEQVELLTAIGDLYVAPLGDLNHAMAAYRQALALAPEDHRVLHKCVDTSVERKDWEETLVLLDRLTGLERVESVRAKYLEAAGLICCDELGRVEEAVRLLSAATAADPTLERAAEALEEIWEAEQAWTMLANLHGIRLQRLGPVCAGGREELHARLWSKLGELCLHRLGERDNALAAFEAAARFEPYNVERSRLLASLYLSVEPPRTDRAIAELQRIIAARPGDPAAYAELERLYAGSDQPIKWAACAEARTFLEGQRALAADAVEPEAGDDVEAALPRVAATLSPELWERLQHPDEDRDLSALFALLAPLIATEHAQPDERLGLDRRDEVKPGDERPFARALKYAAFALGMPLPDAFVRYDQQAPALLVAGLRRNQVAPTLVVGTPLLGHKRSERALIFSLARQLAYLRSGRFLRVLVPTAGQLAHLIDAAIAIGADAKTPPPIGTLGATVRRLKAGLGADAVSQVAAIGRILRARKIDSAASALAWMRATDLTAARVALLLVGDVALCARLVESEPSAFDLLPNERAHDLIAASVSEGMFAARAQLGLK